MLEPVFNLVLTTSVRSSALIVVLLLVRPLVRGRIPMWVLSAAWLLVAVRLFVPATVTLPWAVDLAPLASRLPVPVAAPAVTAAGVPARANPIDPAASAAGAPRPVSAEHDLATALSWLWLAGLLLLLGARALAAWRLHQQLRHAQPVRDERIWHLARDAADRLHLVGGFQVLVTAAVSAPAIAGWRSPRLLLPPRFAEQLSDTELRLVVMHELAHWRRRDLPAQALLAIAQTVHWFNPLVWLAGRAASADCELACDEFVLRRVSSAETRAYGATLLKVLGMVRGQNRMPATLGVLERKQQLKQRIHMIVRFRPLGALRTGATLLLLAALTLVTLTRPGLAQNPVPLPVAGVTAEAPPGWWENGSKLDAYVVGTDTTQPHVKPVSAYVKSTSDTTGSFGGMMQSILPTKYLGQRVRLSAWVKTRDAVKGAHLWLRIDGENRRVLAFDNMNDRPVTGTSDWTACSVVLDVAPEAVGIAYGFFLSDTGQAWINDLKFEVVPPEVTATSRPRPDSPVNLDFSPAANR